MAKVKRIVVGCDGTWLNSDDNFRPASYAPWASKTDGEMINASNVTRLCRALQPRAVNGSAQRQETLSGEIQVVDYHPGIGSSNNWWDHFINGATAMSIGANVNQAYASIAEKYEDGDEIFLFGFSRGAFVARSIAAMIADVGLLNKKGMEYFYDIFQDWENQNIPGWQRRLYPNKSFQDANDGNYCSYARQLALDDLTRLDIRIKAVGCWDTVGSLGVPALSWRKPTRSYAFVNTQPPWNVDNCFQALALDEHRMPFSPTLWELPHSRVPGPSAKNPCVLKQCWFPGSHANVGGSVADAELPDITLAWMIAQLQTLLEFDTEYLEFCQKLNVEYYKQQLRNPRQWGMGFIENSMRGITVLGGSKARTPGRFCRTDTVTGKFTNERLENTNETVHTSVRIRMLNRLNGKGIEDKGSYRPSSLEDFKLKRAAEDKAIDDELDPRQTGFSWEMNDLDAGTKVVLPEEPLGGLEEMLLDIEGLAPTQIDAPNATATGL